MSQPEAGPSRSRRRYIIRACTGCRRRRCKCDGVQPVCGTCLSTGHECTWNTDLDDGRPATKQFIESLRVKIQLLESEIMQFQQGNPQALVPSPSGSGVGSSVLMPSEPSPIGSFDSRSYTSARHSLTPGLSLPQPRYSSSPETHPGSALLYSPLLNIPDVSPHGTQSPFSPAPQLPSAIAYQYIFNIDTSIPFEDQSPQNQASLACNWNRYLPDLSVVQFSRFEHDTILSRCFNYGASWLSGLIPDVFLRELVDCLRPETIYPPRDLQYYSPLSHCSLLAFGAAFSDNPSIRARNTRDRLASHAKQWLDEEYHHSNPSLILSLVLLSEYHNGVGERNTGYMYMGISVRAARIRINSPNVSIRDWYHWSTFVQEKLMALDGGRSNEMPIPNVPFNPPIAVEFGGRPRSTSFATLFEDKEYSKLVVECVIQCSKLMIIAARMIDNMWATRENSTIIDIHLQLDSWFNSLPDGLLIRQRSTQTLPPVLSLHICYWWLILHLHLPLLERIHPSAESEPLAERAVKMCDRATEKLIQLFGAYDKQYGFRYFPRNMFRAIYTCGCALLLEHALAPDGASKKRAMAQEGIDICVYALRGIGETWPCAVPLAGELEARAAGTNPSLAPQPHSFENTSQVNLDQYSGHMHGS